MTGPFPNGLPPSHAVELAARAQRDHFEQVVLPAAVNRAELQAEHALTLLGYPNVRVSFEPDTASLLRGMTVAARSLGALFNDMARQIVRAFGPFTREVDWGLHHPPRLKVDGHAYHRRQMNRRGRR